MPGTVCPLAQTLPTHLLAGPVLVLSLLQQCTWNQARYPSGGSMQVFLSADAAPAPWAPGPQPQALPDSRILVLRSCRTGPELSPRSPGKGEGWGCGSDFVLVPVVNKGVSSSCSPRETASFPRPHRAETGATVLSHPAPPPGAQKAEWGGHWRMARGNECGMGVPSLVGQSEALWGDKGGWGLQAASQPSWPCLRAAQTAKPKAWSLEPGGARPWWPEPELAAPPGGCSSGQ